MAASDRLYFFARFSPVDKRSFILTRDKVTAAKICYLSTIQPEKNKDLYLLDITANMEIFTENDGSFSPETIDSLLSGHEYQVLGNLLVTLDRRDDSDYVSSDEGEFMENPIYCEECGSAVGPDDMFCDCGAPVVLTSGPASTSGDYIFCEECGAILEDRSAQFCECGAVIDWGTIDGQHDGTTSSFCWVLISASPSRDDDDLPEQPGAELDDLLEDLEHARNKPLPPKPSPVVAGTAFFSSEDAVAAAVAGVAALTLHLETEPESEPEPASEPKPEPEPEPEPEPMLEPADIKPTAPTAVEPPPADVLKPEPEPAETLSQPPASPSKSEGSKTPVESTPTIPEPSEPIEPVKPEEPNVTPSSAPTEQPSMKESHTLACPQCHASNAPAARFCRGCGKRLGEAAPTRETRVEVEETMVVEKTARTEEVIVKKPSTNLLAKLMSTPSTPTALATQAAPAPAPAPATKVPASVGPSPEVAAMLARANALKAKEDEAKKAAPTTTSASSAHTSEIDAMKARLAARAKQAEEDKKRKEAEEREEHEKEMQRLRKLEDQRRADRDRVALEIQEKRAAEERQIEEDKQAKLAELEKQRQARAAERQQQQRETQHYESQLQAKEDQEKARANAPQLTRTPSTSQFKEVSAEELKKMTAAQRAFYFIQYERATGKPADTAAAAGAAPKVAKIAPARNPSSGRLDSMVRTGSKGTLERVSKRKEERRSSQTPLQGTPRGASKEALMVVELEEVRPPEKPMEEKPAEQAKGESEDDVKPRKKSAKDGESSSKKRSSKDLKEEPRRSGSKKEDVAKSRSGSKKKIESSDSAKKVEENKKKSSSKGKEDLEGKKKKSEDSTRKKKSDKSVASKSSKKN